MFVSFLLFPKLCGAISRDFRRLVSPSSPDCAVDSVVGRRVCSQAKSINFPFPHLRFYTARKTFMQLPRTECSPSTCDEHRAVIIQTRLIEFALPKLVVQLVVPRCFQRFLFPGCGCESNEWRSLAYKLGRPEGYPTLTSSSAMITCTSQNARVAFYTNFHEPVP